MVHVSGVPGLIHATRAARAVVGIDSGPLHLAAALDKPGVAIFGPTDPARNGPYGKSFTVVRDAARGDQLQEKPEIDASMRAILPETVLEALEDRMSAATVAPTAILMRRHWFPKPYADFVARLRVPGRLSAGGRVPLALRAYAQSLLCGLPVSVLGLWLRGWAAGHLAKNERLATERAVRLGQESPVSRDAAGGGRLVTPRARKARGSSLFAAVFLLVYLPAIELEEQYLRELFPEFEQYAARVPMLCPRPRVPPPTDVFSSASTSTTASIRLWPAFSSVSRPHWPGRRGDEGGRELDRVLFEYVQQKGAGLCLDSRLKTIAGCRCGFRPRRRPFFCGRLRCAVPI